MSIRANHVVVICVVGKSITDQLTGSTMIKLKSLLKETLSAEEIIAMSSIAKNDGWIAGNTNLNAYIVQDPKTGEPNYLIIRYVTYGGHANGTVEEYVDPELAAIGFPSIKELESMFKKVSDRGKPSQQYTVVFKLHEVK